MLTSYCDKIFAFIYIYLHKIIHKNILFCISNKIIKIMLKNCVNAIVNLFSPMSQKTWKISTTIPFSMIKKMIRFQSIIYLSIASDFPLSANIMHSYFNQTISDFFEHNGHKSLQIFWNLQLIQCYHINLHYIMINTSSFLESNQEYLYQRL